MVSIGTGLGNVVTITKTRRSILDALIKMASNSSRVARELEELYQDRDNYFRFNVHRGLEDVTLSDWEETSLISAHTHNYLTEQDRQLKQCARRLVQLNFRVPAVPLGSAPQGVQEPNSVQSLMSHEQLLSESDSSRRGQEKS